MQEVEQKLYKVCIDEWGTSGWTQTWKGSVQKVEAGTDEPGVMQRHCPSVQGWVKKATVYLELNLVSVLQDERDRIKPSFWEVLVGDSQVAYFILFNGSK